MDRRETLDALHFAAHRQSGADEDIDAMLVRDTRDDGSALALRAYADATFGPARRWNASWLMRRSRRPANAARSLRDLLQLAT